MPDTTPEADDPGSSNAEFEVLHLMEYIADETERVAVAIRGIALLAESDHSGVRLVGETALESISELTTTYVSSLSPESNSTYFRRACFAGRRLVSKLIR